MISRDSDDGQDCAGTARGAGVLRTLRRDRPGPKPAVALFTADWTVEDHAAEIVALNAGHGRSDPRSRARRGILQLRLRD